MRWVPFTTAASKQAIFRRSVLPKSLLVELFPLAFSEKVRGRYQRKRFAIIAVISVLATRMAQAEPRTFTNKDGKTVKAELLSVESNSALLKH
jgi:hypothetical protein